jgi:hypothetical protein
LCIAADANFANLLGWVFEMTTIAEQRLQELANSPEEAQMHLWELVDVIDSNAPQGIDDPLLESKQAWATEALENMGPPLPKDIEGLVDACKRRSTPVAIWCAKILGRVKHTDEKLENELIRLVSDPTKALELRRCSLSSLTKLTADQTLLLERLCASSIDKEDPIAGYISQLIQKQNAMS